jgi:lipopolysaccharide export system protein LptC
LSWRTIIILLLLTGALLSGWGLWKHRQPKPLAGDSGRPDYVLYDFELTALDGEGKESFTVRAPNLTRRAGDETMSLVTPLFLLPNGEGKHWEVRAERGWVSADQNELRLTGTVKANSPQDDLRPITMNTEQLSVFPRQNRASSDTVVTVVQPGSILRGRGFSVSTVSKRYVFRSEVKTRYAPTSRQ